MDKSYIAQAVIRLRRERGYKRADDLAEAAGIKVSTLQNLESGRKKTIDTDTLTALCTTLHVSPYELLQGLERPEDAPGGADPFEGMTPAEAYRSGYLAGKERARDEFWADTLAHVAEEEAKIMRLTREQPWKKEA